MTTAMNADITGFKTEVSALEDLKKELRRLPSDTAERPGDAEKLVALRARQDELMESLKVYWTKSGGPGAEWRTYFAKKEREAGGRTKMDRNILLSAHILEIMLERLVERCGALVE